MTSFQRVEIDAPSHRVAVITLSKHVGMTYDFSHPLARLAWSSFLSRSPVPPPPSLSVKGGDL